MALDKDGVKTKLNYYNNILQSAQNCLDGAANQLSLGRGEIEDEWKGEAGSEMSTKLEELHTEIKNLSARIDTIQSSISLRRNSICNNWVDES